MYRITIHCRITSVVIIFIISKLGSFTYHITMQARTGNGIILHKQALLICVVAGVVFLYLVYSWTSSKSSPVSSGTRLKRLNTWKTNDFVDIPLAIIESAKELKIIQKQLSLTISDTVLNIIFSLCIYLSEAFKWVYAIIMIGGWLPYLQYETKYTAKRYQICLIRINQSIRIF